MSQPLTDLLLSLFLIVLGTALIIFNRCLAKTQQRNISKIISDPDDKWAIYGRRFEALLIGVVSLLIGLMFLLEIMRASL